MKTDPRNLIIVVLLAVGCWALFRPDVKSKKTATQAEQIEPAENITRLHRVMCDHIRSGIQAGYLACRLEIPLSNYLAAVESEWDKSLAEKITEAQKLNKTP